MLHDACPRSGLSYLELSGSMWASPTCIKDCEIIFVNPLNSVFKGLHPEVENRLCVIIGYMQAFPLP